MDVNLQEFPEVHGRGLKPGGCASVCLGLRHCSFWSYNWAGALLHHGLPHLAWAGLWGSGDLCKRGLQGQLPRSVGMPSWGLNGF